MNVLLLVSLNFIANLRLETKRKCTIMTCVPQFRFTRTQHVQQASQPGLCLYQLGLSYRNIKHVCWETAWGVQVLLQCIATN